MAKAKLSAHKTIRLTEQADFFVDVLSPLLGQSGNAYISECIQKHSKVIAKERGLDLSELWHSDPSVRALRLFLISDEDYPFNDEQADQRTFVLLHRNFFYDEKEGRLIVNERRAIELYPRLSQWAKTNGDHWAPGKAMAARLKARGLNAPEWPPKDAQ